MISIASSANGRRLRPADPGRRARLKQVLAVARRARPDPCARPASRCGPGRRTVHYRTRKVGTPRNDRTLQWSFFVAGDHLLVAVRISRNPPRPSRRDRNPPSRQRAEVIAFVPSRHRAVPEHARDRVGECERASLELSHRAEQRQTVNVGCCWRRPRASSCPARSGRAAESGTGCPRAAPHGWSRARRSARTADWPS